MNHNPRFAPVSALALTFVTICGFLSDPVWAKTAKSETPRESVGFSFASGLAPTDPRGVDVEAFDEFTGELLTDARIEVVNESRANENTKTVSVSRPGYASLTIYGVTAPRMKAFLKPEAALGIAAVSNGKLTGYLPGYTEHVDGGLMLRSLGVSDLLALNINSLLSPLKDTIQLLGSRKVPSNLVFPYQRVGLLFTLNKPTFRLPVSTARRTRLMAVQAAIRTTQLLDMPSNPDPVFLVNLLKTRKLGFTDELMPTGDFTQDIPLSIDLRSTYTVHVPLPPFGADLFALSLTDLANDRQSLVVSDVKAAREGTYELFLGKQLKLMAPTALPSGSAQHVIAAAVSNGGDRISAVLMLNPSTTVQAPAFLNAPQVKDGPLPEQMKIQAPRDGIALVSLMEARNEAGFAAHHVVVLPEAGEVALPLKTLAGTMPVAKLGVAQLEFTGGFSAKDVDGADVMKKLSRFTFSSGEVQAEASR